MESLICALWVMFHQQFPDCSSFPKDLMGIFREETSLSCPLLVYRPSHGAGLQVRVCMTTPPWSWVGGTQGKVPGTVLWPGREMHNAPSNDRQYRHRSDQQLFFIFARVSLTKGKKCAAVALSGDGVVSVRGDISRIHVLGGGQRRKTAPGHKKGSALTRH